MHQWPSAWVDYGDPLVGEKESNDDCHRPRVRLWSSSGLGEKHGCLIPLSHKNAQKDRQLTGKIERKMARKKIVATIQIKKKKKNKD